MFDDLINQVTSLGPEALTIAILIVLGYVVRAIPRMPDLVVRLLPVTCLVLGAVLYPLLAPAPAPDPRLRHPMVRLVLVGILLGFLAWVLHNKFLKRLEDRIPFLKGLLGDPESTKEL